MRLTGIFLFVAASFVFISCGGKTSNTNSIPDTTSLLNKNTRSALDFFVSDFIKRHPNMDNNNVTFENTANEFSKEFNDQLKTGLLDTLTFYCGGVVRDVVTNKIKATFSVGATSKDSSYSISLFADATINETMANELKEGELYKIKGVITRSEDKLKLRTPTDMYFFKERFDHLIISIHELKLDLKGFTHEQKPEPKLQ